MSKEVLSTWHKLPWLNGHVFPLVESRVTIDSHHVGNTTTQTSLVRERYNHDYNLLVSVQLFLLWEILTSLNLGDNLKTLYHKKYYTSILRRGFKRRTEDREQSKALDLFQIMQTLREAGILRTSLRSIQMFVSDRHHALQWIHFPKNDFCWCFLLFLLPLQQSVMLANRHRFLGPCKIIAEHAVSIYNAVPYFGQCIFTDWLTRSQKLWSFPPLGLAWKSPLVSRTPRGSWGSDALIVPQTTPNVWKDPESI